MAATHGPALVSLTTMPSLSQRNLMLREPVATQVRAKGSPSATASTLGADADPSAVELALGVPGTDAGAGVALERDSTCSRGSARKLTCCRLTSIHLEVELAVLLDSTSR